MKRGRFQGVLLVLRFNWHFFAAAASFVLALGVGARFAGSLPGLILSILALGVVAAVGLSLLATYLAYDASGLYRLSWLEKWIPNSGRGANIHAGFDETTRLLEKKFPDIKWQAYDFYDPRLHTEISINRARRAYPPIPGTIAIQTRSLPVEDAHFDCILLTLAAHEIRDPTERLDFFGELRRTLKPEGRIIVTEHLRDLPNIIVYNFGAWHFHSRSAWLDAFLASRLICLDHFQPAPFIHTFVLGHGSPD